MQVFNGTPTSGVRLKIRSSGDVLERQGDESADRLVLEGDALDQRDLGVGLDPVGAEFSHDGLSIERAALAQTQIHEAGLAFDLLLAEGLDFVLEELEGGAVLLAISLRDILQHEKARKLSSETMGAVPIGTPLVVGPAVLTTIIILLDSYGPYITVLSFIINLMITWITFHYATDISNFLGKAGSKAFSKIASLLLAAIAVMMMRKGIIDTIALFCVKS